MEITNETKVCEAMPFLKPEHVEELMKSDKVNPIPYKKSIFEMTVGEFIMCLDEKYTAKFFEDPDEYLVVAMGRLKHFRNEMENVSKILKMNEIKLSAEEKSAQRGIIFPSFGESMLCECVDYFNLHSLDEAEKIPFSNYLIMKRKKSAESLYERRLNEIISNKNKKK